MDYSIWPYMEQNVYYQRHAFASLEELKDAIKHAWAALPKAIIDSAIEGWRERLKMIYDKDGGHIDHLF